MSFEEWYSHASAGVQINNYALVAPPVFLMLMGALVGKLTVLGLLFYGLGLEKGVDKFLAAPVAVFGAVCAMIGLQALFVFAGCVQVVSTPSRSPPSRSPPLRFSLPDSSSPYSPPPLNTLR